MKVLVFLLFLVLNVAQSSIDPHGHLQPLGEHQPPEKPITVTEILPSPREFFENYVKPGKPLIFRGAAKKTPPYARWTDEYLSKKFGGIKMEVEEGKKENRSLGSFNFKLQDFISRYKKEDVYMVESLPKEMQGLGRHV
ncbi:hypothetical protein QZH41_016172 [Actinostola sp. cb2023]|nr:hypothetical protein QZH41_016172 [Actinostola sp. cb2023]